MSIFFKSSIGRKVSMALSAFLLMFFLITHLSINLTSVFSKDAFNEASHFMGTNPVIQFVLQPVLILGVLFHFIMGFILELQNKKAQSTPYFKSNVSSNSTWMSRNMIYSGITILAFLILHFIDFWFPEISTKYISGDLSGMHNGSYRYYDELTEKFKNPYRVTAYIIAFVFLGLHLIHGFASSFQSMGITVRKKNILQNLSKIYSIVISLGFIIIALFHFLFNNH